jgi:hypothetical protein
VEVTEHFNCFVKQCEELSAFVLRLLRSASYFLFATLLTFMNISLQANNVSFMIEMLQFILWLQRPVPR